MTRLVGQPLSSCYGCLGTGTLQGFGSRPGTACSCVTHHPDCDPSGCDPRCPEHRVAEGVTDGFMRCPSRRCRRFVDYAQDVDPTLRRLWPHEPCDVGMIVKDPATQTWSPARVPV